MDSIEREDSRQEYPEQNEPKQETPEQKLPDWCEKELDNGCGEQSAKLLLMGIIIVAIIFKLFC